MKEWYKAGDLYDKNGNQELKGNNLKHSWKITLILYITSSCPGVLSKYE